MRLITLVIALLALAIATPAFAQYTDSAGQNAPASARKRMKKVADDGTVHYESVRVPVERDQFGNATGNQFDLAVDGAFEGQTIVVLHFYVDRSFDFSLPRDAVAEKGFSVYRYINAPPTPEELEESLSKASQLWLISGDTQLLNEKHVKVIREFYEAGHGLYIWGDNEPYYADANYLAKELFGVTMNGNLIGSQVVGVREGSNGEPGIIANHLLSTGLENVYEGITIATVDQNQALTPLIYGSAGNLVAAFYDNDGRRAIFDGGFTRLYCNWNTAGTPRYIKNAAAWLANYEKFGQAVLAVDIK